MPYVALLGLAAVAGRAALSASWFGTRTREPSRPRRAVDPAAPTAPGGAGLSDDVRGLLAALPGIVVVTGTDDGVVWASAPALASGLVAGDRLGVSEVTTAVGQVRRDGVTREVLVTVPRGALRARRTDLRVRVASLAAGATLVLAEDVSQEQRLDAVRRDFVANVSHELKTPVGALSLLAEAVQAGVDEPEEVARFAARMQEEAKRLTSLVNDLIDLSRLQGASAPSTPLPTSVRRVVAEAVEATRMLAQSQGIEVVVGAVPDVAVLGDENQLVTALRNLLTNAVAYSPARTRVAVTGRVGEDGPAAGMVDIGVTDQGIGIPVDEQGRIFERFYRVDPARSRQTGGTGLGLSIVKHVCANHGGECLVWSVPGEGSTFTLRLPVTDAPAPPAGVGGPEPKERVG